MAMITLCGIGIGLTYALFKTSNTAPQNHLPPLPAAPASATSTAPLTKQTQQFLTQLDKNPLSVITALIIHNDKPLHERPLQGFAFNLYQQVQKATHWYDSLVVYNNACQAIELCNKLALTQSREVIINGINRDFFDPLGNNGIKEPMKCLVFCLNKKLVGHDGLIIMILNALHNCNNPLQYNNTTLIANCSF